MDVVETQETELGIVLFNRRATAKSSGTVSKEALDSVILQVTDAAPGDFSRDAVVTASTFADLPDAVRAKAEAEGYDESGRNAEGQKITGVTYDGSRNLIAVAGHELLHEIKASRPDLYQWFVEQATPYVRNFPAYLHRLNSGIRPGEMAYDGEAGGEELLSDFTGDALADPKFLQQLADDNPGKFTRLLNAVQQWLAGVLSRLQGNRSEEFISDVRALRAHLAQALKIYAEGGSIADLLGEPKFSGRRSANSTMESRAGEAGTTGATPADIRAGMVKAFGERSIRQLEANGLVNIVATAEDLPAGVHIGLTGKAVFVGDRAYFIANRMEGATAHVELLHEIGEHYGLARMLGADG